MIPIVGIVTVLTHTWGSVKVALEIITTSLELVGLCREFWSFYTFLNYQPTPHSILVCFRILKSIFYVHKPSLFNHFLNFQIHSCHPQVFTRIRDLHNSWKQRRCERCPTSLEECHWNLTQLSTRCQFHQCSTSSFCASRFQKHKKILTTWLNSYAFGSYGRKNCT